jgi:hypothetical protein
MEVFPYFLNLPTKTSVRPINSLLLYLNQRMVSCIYRHHVEDVKAYRPVDRKLFDDYLSDLRKIWDWRKKEWDRRRRSH